MNSQAVVLDVHLEQGLSEGLSSMRSFWNSDRNPSDRLRSSDIDPHSYENSRLSH